MRCDDESSPILLIGVNGQLGWELQRSLRPLGPLLCTARGVAPGAQTLDLAKLDGLRQLIRTVQPRLIVNAAAYTLVDQAEREPDQAQTVNGVAPGVIQEEARRLGIAAVHYSTDYVFDGGGDRPWTEADPPHPLNVYGSTKLAGERAVAEAGGDFWILRTSWIYGVHGANFVKKMLQLAGERRELRIVADQIGAPTSARYLADVTAQLLAQSRGDFAGWAATHGGAYHVCCRGETSWHGFAERIIARARAVGATLAVERIEPIPSSEFPTPARRPLNSRLSCERLRREFKLTAPSWEDALEDALPDMIPPRP